MLLFISSLYCFKYHYHFLQLISLKIYHFLQILSLNYFNISCLLEQCWRFCLLLLLFFHDMLHIAKSIYSISFCIFFIVCIYLLQGGHLSYYQLNITKPLNIVQECSSVRFIFIRTSLTVCSFIMQIEFFLKE